MDGMASQIAAMAGISLSIAGVVKLGQAINDLAIQSGKVQQLKDSFDGLAMGVGQSSDAMLASMRRASDGLVSDADLILSANKAMLLGVADTSAEMTALINVARSRGAAMGLTLTQAFNDIVTGLGRESALILDNLGITIKLEQVMQDYAASLGKTAAQLDATERKQALLNEVMRQSAGMTKPIETAATAWERAAVAIDNAKLSLGEAFGPVVMEIAKGTTYLADALQEVFAGIREAEAQWLLFGDKIADVDKKIADLYATVEDEPAWMPSEFSQTTNDIYAQVDALKEERNALVKAAEAAREHYMKLAGLREVTAMTREEAEQLTASTRHAWTEWEKFGITAEEARAELSQLASGLGWVGEMALSASKDVASFNRNVASIKSAIDATNAIISSGKSQAETLAMQAVQAGADPAAVRQLLVQTTSAIDGLTFAYQNNAGAQFDNRMQINASLQSLQDLVDETNNANDATKKLAEDGVKFATQKFEDLRSKVSSVVGGLLSINDISINAGGPRQDAANENARRLADIANIGLADQSWMEEFKTEVPAIFDEIVSAADPRAAAAKLYEEFQAGMHPELLDRDMIKENIRRMIIGEETMNAYVSEIAQELATEMNMSFPDAYAAAVGEGGFADGFTKGTDSLKEVLGDEKTAFKEAGTNILGAFQEGIEGQWAGFLEFWRAKMTELRNQLPFSEPKDPRSPLRGLSKSGKSILTQIQSGIDRESFNVNVLGTRAQAAATTTNNTMPVSITVNVNGGGDGQMIAESVRGGVLSAARSMGIR